MNIKIVKKTLVPYAPAGLLDRVSTIEDDVALLRDTIAPVNTVEIALRWGSLTIPGGAQARGVITVQNVSSEAFLWMPVVRIWNAFSQSNGGATISPALPASTAAFSEIFGYVYLSPTLDREEPLHPSCWWGYDYKQIHSAVNWVYFDNKTWNLPEDMSAYMREPGGVLLAPGETRKFNVFQTPTGMTTSSIYQPVNLAFASPKTAVAKTITSKGAPAAGWDDNALIVTMVRPLQMSISYDPAAAHASWV